MLNASVSIKNGQIGHISQVLQSVPCPPAGPDSPKFTPTGNGPAEPGSATPRSTKISRSASWRTPRSRFCLKPVRRVCSSGVLSRSCSEPDPNRESFDFSSSVSEKSRLHHEVSPRSPGGVLPGPAEVQLPSAGGWRTV